MKFIKKFLRVGAATQGYGLFERMLSLQRARLAHYHIDRILKDSPKNSVLDIGCGAFPIYLLTSKFIRKYGLDKIKHQRPAVRRRLKLVSHSVEKKGSIPFESNYLDAVTMLAVFEHLEYDQVLPILKEIYRVLRPGGVFVMTTPSTWSDWLLRILAKIKLVSSAEIEDHKINLTTKEILSFYETAGFKTVETGFFEFSLNRWFVAVK